MCFLSHYSEWLTPGGVLGGSGRGDYIYIYVHMYIHIFIFMYCQTPAGNHPRPLFTASHGFDIWILLAIGRILADLCKDSDKPPLYKITQTSKDFLAELLV